LSSFQRRLDLLDHIPGYPKKTSTKQLLRLLEIDGHKDLNMRKIQRDLELIESLAMFGLEVDKRSKPYGWSINLNWKKLNISLMDANSALAFSTLKEVASTLLPESTLIDLTDYFNKAELILASEKSPLISHWKKSVALVNTQNPVTLPLPDEGTLAKIKQAIFHEKQISANLKRYLIANKAPIWKEYHPINPLGLIQHEYMVTLICSLGAFHDKIYKFPIAFIKDVEIKETDSITPKNYDFDKVKYSYFSSNASNRKIKLSLLARKDSYFVLSNGRFSDEQILEDTKNPEIVRITATVPDTPKLRAFLRGLGNTIEVLEPQILRDYFKELAQCLLAKYQ